MEVVYFAGMSNFILVHLSFLYTEMMYTVFAARMKRVGVGKHTFPFYVDSCDFISQFVLLILE